MRGPNPAIQKGLRFIHDNQESDGGFLNFSSQDASDFSQAASSRTVFIPAIILGALGGIDTPQAKVVKARLADFLLAQKSPNWTFNYWPKGAPEAKKLPYPDDLDDTFCALGALFAYDPKLVDGKALAAVVNLLTLVEKEEGGPYGTWAVPKEADDVWRDVDMAVNFNVANFLATQGVSLPSLDSLAQKAITARAFKSSYYPDEFPLIYFLSRWYNGPLKPELGKYILSLKDSTGSFGSPLQTALALSALLNLGTAPQKLTVSLEYLQRAQNPDGSWGVQAFCLDPYLGGHPKFVGSKELSTALVLEALTKSEALKPAPNIKRAQGEDIYKAVCAQVEQRAAGCKPSLKAPIMKSLNLFCGSDLGRQAALLPLVFYKSLKPSGTVLSKSDLTNLGAATLYGWIAYTIYDDFLDGEGEPGLLPAANLALRELTLVFNDFYKQHGGSWETPQKILDGIDAANAWEATHCRFMVTDSKLSLSGLPDYGSLGQLADKSFGHALGPLAVLSRLGEPESSRDSKALQRFFRHYLIARQLNDDAHDWAEDLRRGQVNAVAVTLLEGYKLPAVVNPQKLISQLQEKFWTQTIIEVANQIKRHVRMARTNLLKVGLIDDPKQLLKLLEPLLQAAEQSILEHQTTAEFLESLGSPHRPRNG